MMVIHQDVLQIFCSLRYVDTEFFSQPLFLDPGQRFESILRKLVNPIFRFIWIYTHDCYSSSLKQRSPVWDPKASSLILKEVLECQHRTLANKAKGQTLSAAESSAPGSLWVDEVFLQDSIKIELRI
jgi:hypothetical protein